MDLWGLIPELQYELLGLSWREGAQEGRREPMGLHAPATTLCQDSLLLRLPHQQVRTKWPEASQGHFLVPQEVGLLVHKQNDSQARCVRQQGPQAGCWQQAKPPQKSWLVQTSGHSVRCWQGWLKGEL